MDEHEARAFANSVAIEPMEELDDLLNSQQVGQVLCWRTAEKWTVAAAFKPSATEDEREGFKQYARDRIVALLVTESPEMDGWFPREAEEDCWQITARVVDMPPEDPFD